MMTTTTHNLASLGEFGFIARLRQKLRDQAGRADVVLAIGDDCSACTLPAGELLLTSTDLLIENIHFRRDWTSLYALGRKSAAVNLSDIAAMGGTPRYLHLGLGLPQDLVLDELDAFCDGFLDECRAAGALLCGGDTCRSQTGMFISVSVQGTIPADQLVRRSGGQPGDRLYVSGTLGDSALALHLLQQGQTPPAALARRHHQPTPRLALGRALAAAGLAHAMIDLSDGLLADLGHILQQSQLAACLDPAALPLSVDVRRHLNHKPEDLDVVLRGGEDYELLFSAPPEAAPRLEQLAVRLALPLTAIGSLQPGEGLWLCRPDGSRQPVEARGFNHFQSGQPA